MIKAILPASIRDTLVILDNVDDLKTIIAPDQLPPDLGGTGPLLSKSPMSFEITKHVDNNLRKAQQEELKEEDRVQEGGEQMTP